MAAPERDTRRVAYVVESDGYGGAESYVGILVGAAPRDTAHLVAVGELAAPLLDDVRAHGSKVIRAPQVRDKRDLRAFVALARTLRSLPVDLVHVNLASYTNNRHALFASLLARRATVVTVHVPGALPGGLQRRLLRRALNRAGAVIAVSQEIAHQLEVWGVRSSAIRVVANGVDTSRFEPTERPGEGVLRIGSVGRLTSQKGFDVLIRATARLVEEGHRLEVRIAGDGPARRELEDAARNLPIEFVRFTDEVAGFLADLDVFCLPSRWEGLPLALLEAMSAGLPCVATAVGGVPSLGDTILVVPPDDVDALAAAIASLVEDSALRADLGARARERIEADFSVDRMVAATHRVYEEVTR